MIPSSAAEFRATRSSTFLKSRLCNSPRRAYTPAVDMKANHSTIAWQRPAPAPAARRRLPP